MRCNPNFLSACNIGGILPSPGRGNGIGALGQYLYVSHWELGLHVGHDALGMRAGLWELGLRVSDEGFASLTTKGSSLRFIPTGRLT